MADLSTLEVQLLKKLKAYKAGHKSSETWDEVKGADIHHSSESSQLENFLADLQDLPYHSQQTFLNQLITRCVLRVDSRDNLDSAVFGLQKALGDDVDQYIPPWLARLRGAVCRVSQQPLHPLLSSFERQDLAQRTVELLQRELDNVKAPNDIRYQQAPISPPIIQLTSEQEHLLWDLGLGIDPSVNKRAPDAIHIPQKEIDWIVEKARELPSFQPMICEVDTSKVCSVIFCRVGSNSGLSPERLNSLSNFIGSTLKQFPILASITDFAIAETLYLLWSARYNYQYLYNVHPDISQSLFETLRGLLQHAQSRVLTVVVFLGLRTIAYLLGGGSDRPPALNPYVPFCSLMGGSPSPDKEATLDSMCLSMVTELRQLEEVDLGQFVMNHTGRTETDVAISLERSYFQCRLANPPVGHRETVRHLATKTAADSRQAHQGLSKTDGGDGET